MLRLIVDGGVSIATPPAAMCRHGDRDTVCRGTTTTASVDRRYGDDACRRCVRPILINICLSVPLAKERTSFVWSCFSLLIRFVIFLKSFCVVVPCFFFNFQELLKILSHIMAEKTICRFIFVAVRNRKNRYLVNYKMYNN